MQGARTVCYSVSLDFLYGEDAACNKGDNISDVGLNYV